MESAYPFLQRISQLGEYRQSGTLELAGLMEDAARGVNIQALDVAVEQLDQYYRLQALAIGQGKVANGQAQVEFDNALQAKQMLISVAAFNLGVAVRPGFKVKLEKVIEPGGFFGVANLIEDRSAILTRQTDPKAHLSIAIAVFNTFNSIP